MSRVFFITGTSTGIGRALAELILERGEIAIATARRPSTLDDLTKQYSTDRLLVLELDVTKPEQIADAFVKSKAAFGRIDVVVNNAGYGNLGEVESMTESQARAILETNFWGAVNITKEALNFFRESNPPGAGGRLLQVGSYLGLVCSPALGYYSASKFALEGITETLAAEIDPAWNIKITLLEPGWIRSASLPKATWSTQHPAYTSNAELLVNVMRKGSIEDMVTWKSTRKSVEVIYKAASLPHPPLHLVIGQDAIDATRRKIAELADTLKTYEQWSEGLEEV